MRSDWIYGVESFTREHGRGVLGDAEVARCGAAMHLVLLCYPATSLAPVDSNCISAAHRLAGLLRRSADSKSSFYLSAKRNKVVLNRVGRVCLACLLVLLWTEWWWAGGGVAGRGSGLHKPTVKSSNWRQLRGKIVDLNPGCSLAASGQKIKVKLEKIWKTSTPRGEAPLLQHDPFNKPKQSWMKHQFGLPSACSLIPTVIPHYCPLTVP